jgi:hypothetical protein
VVAVRRVETAGGLVRRDQRSGIDDADSGPASLVAVALGQSITADRLTANRAWRDPRQRSVAPRLVALVVMSSTEAAHSA